uniref:Uncharacterized protein n=1 Tax=viral metagenome TaxID=1070528 RepID=A0A6C0LPF6_9ZZZZ
MKFLSALTFLAVLSVITDGFLFPIPKTVSNRRSLQLRDGNNPLITCNEKYVYMKYLIGIRNLKRVYRIVKDNHLADIQNAVNILNVLNFLNNTQMTITRDNNAYDGNSMQINNTDKIAKNLILSNIYIDVSTVKYIQISTKNDTLIVELDKNNANTNSNVLYDISKIDNFLSSISLLMKIININ